MATTVTFANGNTLPYLEAIKGVTHHGGTQRASIVIEFANDAITLDQLDVLCTEGNLGTLTLHKDEVRYLVKNEQGEDVEMVEPAVTNVLEDYKIRMELARKAKLVDAVNQVYEDRVYLTLGQLTFIEKKLAALGIL